MLSAVYLVLFGFLALVWITTRRARAREAQGELFQPEGKLRWTADGRTVSGRREPLSENA